MQTTQYLEKLSIGMNKRKSELTALAVNLDLQKLWQDFLLGQYIHQEISKDEAIEQIDSHLVTLAAQQRETMQLENNWQKQ